MRGGEERGREGRGEGGGEGRRGEDREGRRGRGGEGRGGEERGVMGECEHSHFQEGMSKKSLWENMRACASLCVCVHTQECAFIHLYTWFVNCTVLVHVQTWFRDNTHIILS